MNNKNVVNLRDIKRPEEPTEKVVIPTVPFVPPVTPVERDPNLTREQARVQDMCFFFERPDGTYFSTSAIDAWNQKQQRNGNRFVGVSDGRTYLAMMAQAYQLNQESQARLKRFKAIYERLEKEEDDLMLMSDGPAKDKAKRDLKIKWDNAEANQQKLESETAELTRPLEERALAAEYEVAKKNGGKVIDFSVMGNGAEHFNPDGQ